MKNHMNLPSAIVDGYKKQHEIQKGRKKWTEDSPNKEKMRPESWWGNESNKKYGPVKRFLMNNVGKCWDEVLETVHRRYNPQSALGRNLLNIIKNVVETDPIHAKNFEDFGSWTHFYVRDGRLRVQMQKRVKVERPKPNWYNKKEKQLFVKHEQLWFIVQLKEVPQPYCTLKYNVEGKEYRQYGDHIYDCFFGWCRVVGPQRSDYLNFHAFARKYGMYDYYGISRKSCNKKEIAQAEKFSA